MPNRTVSLQCPTAEYPCSAQPPSIPAMPNRRVSLQCPTAEYACSAQPPKIPAVPNRQVSLQCPTAEYPCSAHNHKASQQCPTAGHRRVSLQCPTAEYPCSAQPQSISILPNRRISTLRASFTAHTCSTWPLEVVDVALERRRVKGADVRSR